MANAYFVIRKSDRQIVGMIQICHSLNDKLFQKGSHIGYNVHLTEGCKDYATEILYQVLERCGDFVIDKVLVACDKSILGPAQIS